MLTLLLNFALDHPKGLETAGGLVVRVAFVALGLGFLLGGLSSVMSSLPGSPGPLAAQHVLAGLPTWWVPESPIGAAAWAAVLGLGLLMVVGSRELCRQLKAYR